MYIFFTTKNFWRSSETYVTLNNYKDSVKGIEALLVIFLNECCADFTEKVMNFMVVTLKYSRNSVNCGRWHRHKPCHPVYDRA